MTAGAHVPGPQRSHQLVCNYSSETVKTMMAANGAPESSGKSERNKRQSDRKTERKKRGREKRPTSSAFFSRMVPTDRGCWEVVSKSVLLLQQILPILHRSYGMLDDDSRFFLGFLHSAMVSMNCSCCKDVASTSMRWIPVSWILEV